MENNDHRWCWKRKSELNLVQVLADEIAESSDSPTVPFSMSDPSTYLSLIKTVVKIPEDAPNPEDMVLPSQYKAVAVNAIELINSVNHLVSSYETVVGDATSSRLNSDQEALASSKSSAKEVVGLNRALSEPKSRLEVERANVASLKGHLAVVGEEQERLRFSCESWRELAKMSEKAMHKHIDF